MGGGSGGWISHTVVRVGVVYVCGRHRYAYTESSILFTHSSLSVLYALFKQALGLHGVHSH